MSGLRVLEGRLANGLGRIGDRLGADWLVYSPLRMHQFHLMAKDDAPSVVQSLFDVFPDACVLADVGAGSGAYAAEVNRRGRLAVACEKSSSGRFLARLQGVDARPFDLANDVPAALPRRQNGAQRSFDLAYCIEVAEHLPPALGERLIEFLAGLTRTVVFTAARPGQGGTGHINEQPMTYWTDRFAKFGMEVDSERTALLKAAFRRHNVQAHWLHENLVVVASRVP